MRQHIRTLALVSGLTLAIAARGRNAGPETVVDELLAADRAFSAASAKTDLISGLTAMLADDVTMPLPGGLFANGVEKVAEALRANPDNAKSSVEWTPIRGGVSADGLHGFTLGYMTLRKPDNTTAPGKYLSYWEKGPRGWRVAAYKRGRSPEGSVSLEAMPPSLPMKNMAPVTDAAVVAEYHASLARAEQTFSDDAQTMGLGPAFAKFGSADAVNMGAGRSFIVGAAAIGRSIGDSTGSPVVWKSDRVIVASSGDLGVSIGIIRRNGNLTGPSAAFFTIWRRESPSAPWRYVAE